MNIKFGAVMVGVKSQPLSPFMNFIFYNENSYVTQRNKKHVWRDKDLM